VDDDTLVDVVRLVTATRRALTRQKPNHSFYGGFAKVSKAGAYSIHSSAVQLEVIFSCRIRWVI
jgi:hypothetical protein